jgi:cytidine deaminase
MAAAPKVQSSSNPADVSATCAAHDLTEPEFHDLRRQAVTAKAQAYCPYSRFRVGAALLPAAAEDGGGGEEVAVVVTGANVENAAYPVGTCAERVAFGTAVVQGHRRFRALAVATDIAPPASPCGMCRQL